jgi:hypothetical protein
MQDLKIGQLGKQQDAVAQYLDTVDEVLFSGPRAMSGGGHSRKRAGIARRSWSRRRRAGSRAPHFRD